MSLESIIVILFAVTAGAVVKGLSGLGLPMIAIPLMTGFLGVERAVALMVLPTMLTNFWQLWAYRTHATTFPNLGASAAIGIVGVVLGSWILASVPGRWLTALLALWLGLYLVSVAFRFEPRIDRWNGRWPSFVVIWLAGVLQGATGASGPIVGPYAHALGLRKGAYVFAVSALFQIFGITQLTALLWNGILDSERIAEGLVACIPVIVVLPIAMRFSLRFSTRAFELMLLSVFVLMEARLIYRILA